MNIISKLIKKFFSKKKEVITVEGRNIHEIIQETLKERTSILDKLNKKELEPMNEIELGEELVNMSEKPTKPDTTKKPKSPKTNPKKVKNNVG